MVCLVKAMETVMLSGKEWSLSAGSECPAVVTALIEDKGQMTLPNIPHPPNSCTTDPC